MQIDSWRARRVGRPSRKTNYVWPGSLLSSPPQQAAAACLVQYPFPHAQDSGGTHNSFLSAELPPLTRYELLLEAPWPFSKRHLYRGLKTGSQKVGRQFRTKLLCGRSIKSPNRENQGPDELSEQDQSKLEICLPGICPRGSSAYYSDSTPHLT